MDCGVYIYNNGEWVKKNPDFSKGLHVLYFGNNKCGACRLFDPYWELAIKKIDIDATFWMIRCDWFERECDSEEAKKLFTEYDISSSPTLILIKDGEIIDRISGVLSTGELIAWIKGNIQEGEKEKKKHKLGFTC